MMYDMDYQDRVDIRQICEFIKTGAENTTEMQSGTPQERHEKNGAAFTMAMRTFRDRVLSYDWDAVKDGKERELKTERLYEEVVEALGDLQDLAYEMGFRAGFSISKQLFDDTELFGE